jgi:threonine dehydrogenase-like Zn-dependent dehydrogenase
MEAKSFWHIDKNHSEIQSEIIDKLPLENSVFIKSGYSALSLGTEKIVATGNVPIEMFEKMSVPYMKGSFEFPIKYGYSLVGQTDDNNWVHLMHPHQNKTIVSRDNCYILSPETNPIVATQLSNLETVINAIWTSKVKKGDLVLVCGTGSIGILLAQTLKKYSQAEVYIQETNQVKKEKLVEWGFTLCNSKTDYDICFNVSANANGLQYCINHCAIEGKIIELSWYGNTPVCLQLGIDFHYKRLQIISSQVSEIPLDMKHEYDFKSRKQLAEKLINIVDFLPFIAKYLPFEELPDFFKKIRNNEPINDFITVVKY